MKLELGKIYLTRNGMMTTPICESIFSKYPFNGQIGNGTHHNWTEDGSFTIGKISPLDLIEEKV